jgi:hypothetical protein
MKLNLNGNSSITFTQNNLIPPTMFTKLREVSNKCNYSKNGINEEKQSKMVKLNSDETSILKNMSINNFSSHLRFNDIRNVVKKEIWKLAMKEVKSKKVPSKPKTKTNSILLSFRFNEQTKKEKLSLSNKQPFTNYAL